jgi:hypothetical protein
MYNVVLRRIQEKLLPWKSNKYYIFLCVCVCVEVGGWVSVHERGRVLAHV